MPSGPDTADVGGDLRARQTGAGMKARAGAARAASTTARISEGWRFGGVACRHRDTADDHHPHTWKDRLRSWPTEAFLLQNSASHMPEERVEAEGPPEVPWGPAPHTPELTLAHPPQEPSRNASPLLKTTSAKANKRLYSEALAGLSGGPAVTRGLLAVPELCPTSPQGLAYPPAPSLDGLLLRERPLNASTTFGRGERMTEVGTDSDIPPGARSTQ